MSSNSDPGMSGSFVPFVKLYDRFYFNPEHEPCDAEYNSIKELHDGLKGDKGLLKKFPELKESIFYQIPQKALTDLQHFIDYYEAYRDQFAADLTYLPILIHEKED